MNFNQFKINSSQNITTTQDNSFEQPIKNYFFEFSVDATTIRKRLTKSGRKRPCTQKQVMGYSAKEFLTELGAVIEDRWPRQRQQHERRQPQPGFVVAGSIEETVHVVVVEEGG